MSLSSPIQSPRARASAVGTTGTTWLEKPPYLKSSELNHGLTNRTQSYLLHKGPTVAEAQLGKPPSAIMESQAVHLTVAVTIWLIVITIAIVTDSVVVITLIPTTTSTTVMDFRGIVTFRLRVTAYHRDTMKLIRGTKKKTTMSPAQGVVTVKVDIANTATPPFRMNTPPRT